MGRLIDADTVVHWQSYDDEYETFQDHEGTIAEFLDSMTDEGCPECVNTLPSALQEAVQRIEKKVVEVYEYPKTEYAEGYVNACKAVIKMLKSLSPGDAVPVVRCKDCKHRPTGTNRDDLEFPDDKCPCKCEDYWYSWKPSDDWFCGNGERKDGDGNE